MKNKILYKVNRIQPSQLFLNSDKIKKYYILFKDKNNEIDPIPINKIEDRIIFLDGHSRAFVLWKMGYEEVEVYWEKNMIDRDMYKICVKLCIDEGIYSISDLEYRILDNITYVEKWIRRCREIYEELEKIRKE